MRVSKVDQGDPMVLSFCEATLFLKTSKSIFTSTTRGLAHPAQYEHPIQIQQSIPSFSCILFR